MLKARPAIIAVVGGQSFVRVFELFLFSVPRLESWESESHVHIDGKEKKMEGKKKRRRRRAGVGNDYLRNVLPSSVVLGDKISLGQEEREETRERKFGRTDVEEGVANFETDAGRIFEFDFPPTETRRGMISGIGRVARHNVRSVPFDTAARYR